MTEIPGWTRRQRSTVLVKPQAESGGISALVCQCDERGAKRLLCGVETFQGAGLPVCSAFKVGTRPLEIVLLYNISVKRKMLTSRILRTLLGHVLRTCGKQFYAQNL